MLNDKHFHQDSESFPLIIGVWVLIQVFELVNLPTGLTSSDHGSFCSLLVSIRSSQSVRAKVVTLLEEAFWTAKASAAPFWTYVGSGDLG